MEKNANADDALFEYVRQIIYAPEQVKALDGADLPAPKKKLIQGLRVLRQFVLENKAFCADLANGTIKEARLPSRENIWLVL